jgi:uncharacterized protein (DUF924 family)
MRQRNMHWREVYDFWFKKHGKKDWFGKSAKFDAAIRRKFLSTYWEIARGEHADWRTTPKGRLSEIIVLDQFARQMFRGEAQAFLFDPLALALAQEAIRSGADKALKETERFFIYLPFMHSESKKIQKESVRLFKKLGDKEALWYARDHKKVIDRFGRFPHRNAARGWKSTPAEKSFMRSHRGY